MERACENIRELRLDLRVPAGHVEIDAVETDGVELRLEPLTDAARELMDSVTVDLRRHGAGHELVVDVPERKGFGWFLGRGPEFHLAVRCPSGTAADVRTASADLETRGLLGALGAKTASGDVRVERVHEKASVQTASGDIELEQARGAAEVTTASGDITVLRAAAGLRANLVSGDFAAREIDGDVRVTSVSGDQEIEAAGPGIVELQSVSGDIRVGIRRGLTVWMDVRSLSGDMASDLTPSDGPGDEDTQLVELRVKSVSGDIRLEQAAAAASPAPGSSAFD